jgi:Aspartyl/Asparaginyl beta-hydroxylase
MFRTNCLVRIACHNHTLRRCTFGSGGWSATHRHKDFSQDRVTTTTSSTTRPPHPRRHFSSEPSSNDSSGMCDVIQGPSLLRTPYARPNPSLLILPGLRSLPFWTSPDHTKVAYGDPTVQYVVQLLEEHADRIRDEYLHVAPTIPSDYQETGGNTGSGDQQHVSLHQGSTPWKWHSYLTKGHVQGPFVQSFPVTSSILQQLRSEGILFEGTPFGFAFFSTLGPESTIAPHTAPMNLRLRIHLSLTVPNTTTMSASNQKDDDDDSSLLYGIRVGIQERTWIPNKALVFDDSYQHEVWNHHTTDSRVILLVDIWHPDIPHDERTSIVQLFQQARLDGLWKR